MIIIRLTLITGIFLSFLETHSQTSFSVPKEISSSINCAYSVYNADFNNDGEIDVLCPSYYEDRIIWFEKNVYGNNYIMHVISDEADGAYCVHAADLDGDDDMDVISTSINDKKIAWYENDGHGNFSEQKIISTDAHNCKSVYSGDIDNDGDIDIISFTTTNNQITWFENDDSGLFIPHLISGTIYEPNSVFCADLDNNGYLDVIAARGSEDKIVWNRNLGDGSFGIQKIISDTTIGVKSVFAADLDNDGDQDVVTASPINGVSLFVNGGTGNFSSSQCISAKTDLNDVQCADLDNDGDLDIAVTGFGYDIYYGGFSYNYWIENFGGGSFSSEKYFSGTVTAPRSLNISDVNGDDFPDILITDYYGVSIFNNNGNGGFVYSKKINWNYSNPFNFYDYDFDGDMDVIAAYNKTLIAYINENGLFNSRKTIVILASGDNPVINTILCNDINNDDINEIILGVNYETEYHFNYTGFHSYSQTEPEIFIESGIGSTNNFLGGLFISDIDNNIFNDYGFISGNSDLIVSFNNDGLFTDYQLVVDDTIDFSINADLDGDLDLDFITANSSGNKISWFSNDGTGIFGSEQIISSLSDNPMYLNAADMDNDSDLDIISTSTGDNTIAWYENDGSGNFISQNTISNNSYGAFQTVIADLDNDSDLDIIACQPMKIVWYENDGSLNFTDAITIADICVTDIKTNDFDHDGDFDIFYSNSSVYKLGVIENLRFGIINQPQDLIICPDSNVSFTISENIADSLQWQINTDSVFVNIENNSLYSGVDSCVLSISGVNFEMNGDLFRCLLFSEMDTIYSSYAKLSVNDYYLLNCPGSRTIVLDFDDSVYTIQGNEFDYEILSECPGTNIISIENDYNDSSSLDGAILPEGNTNILWTAADDLGNTYSCTFSLFVHSLQSIKELNNLGILIYPNPTSGLICFEFDEDKIGRINILDLNGKIVLEKSNINKYEIIDISMLQSGLYFIHIVGVNQSYTTKIIKE